jgi:hypothetical protein
MAGAVLVRGTPTQAFLEMIWWQVEQPTERGVRHETCRRGRDDPERRRF